MLLALNVDDVMGSYGSGSTIMQQDFVVGVDLVDVDGLKKGGRG